MILLSIEHPVHIEHFNLSFKHPCPTFGLVVSYSMIAAHMMDPQNMDILASLAQSLLLCGKHSEALKCAEIVLYQVKGNLYYGFLMFFIRIDGAARL